MGVYAAILVDPTLDRHVGGERGEQIRASAGEPGSRVGTLRFHAAATLE